MIMDIGKIEDPAIEDIALKIQEEINENVVPNNHRVRTRNDTVTLEVVTYSWVLDKTTMDDIVKILNKYGFVLHMIYNEHHNFRKKDVIKDYLILEFWDQDFVNLKE